MIGFNCNVCQHPLQVAPEYAGKKVRCPNCLAVVDAPAPVAVPVTAARGDDIPVSPAPPPIPPPRRTAPAPGGNPWVSRFGGKRYGFHCPYCSSRLEATENMAAQDGQCPTCGNQITIPILDRYNRLIDPHTRQIIKQDPHPVHAYAAAGDRAPKILRDNNGNQLIVCPRCGARSAITSNNCKSCGMPFTMEGTTFDAAGATDGLCVTALVVGIVGLIAFKTLLVPILAIAFGAFGLRRVADESKNRGGKGMGIAGICLGILGLIFFAISP